ncbi:hypothetical protein ASPZODRAFT_147409 [Penicilliopsis zonata CBS 506.65]|uniref:Major facilitator superfamily (MFS) profile domain-containing protein n=1 Tax=Penicilliopsis zonata CBS 506.65 TaxID=1073090 RepID=A0A1L9S578_9EURO|nr:hypothetical protein ASPZODRAFT_147409 [Penicilliopsis zonata CBS 506.65]OJJ42316.1 hypothetical protein ASPZODRAFT_147409 [Penicilliopsis zonata CBS 506.65]
MMLWGCCMLGMGFVTDWSGLMAARWFLGLCEAGLYPGINYYLSCWYKRSEFGVRARRFPAPSGVSWQQPSIWMDGIGNRPGWAWIFILEGLLTVVIGALSFVMVHDFPDQARFLSAEDRTRVIRRLRLDQQASGGHEEFSIRYFWDAVRDWKMWLGMAIYMGCDMPLYAFSLFLPTIVSDLGWSTTVVRSQLMSVPPYAAATAFTVLIGFVADRTQARGMCNLLVSLLGVAGFAMLLGSATPAVQYAGTFLGALGIYPCIANTISWVANNIKGSYKRGIVLGPRFIHGHALIIAYMTVFLFGGSLLMTVLLRRENARRRRGDCDGWIQGKTEEEVVALGDRRPDFIYTV